MNYYVLGPDNQPYGPADEATLRQWAGEGRIFPHTSLTDSAHSRVFPASELLPPYVFAPVPPGSFQPAQEVTGQGCAGGGLGCFLTFILLIISGLLVGWLSNRIPAFASGFPFVGSVALLYSGQASAVYFALRRWQPALARGAGFGLLIGVALTLGIGAICGSIAKQMSH